MNTRTLTQGLSTLAVAGFALLSAAWASGAAITHNSTTLISSGSDFTVSVFDAKAGYAGTGSYEGATGTFGDGTVEAYAFAKNTVLGGGSYGENEIGFYATGGSSITIDSHNGATTYSDFDRGDVWTTNDPDSAAANFGGSTETISGGYEVTGTIDISNYTSGSAYVLLGGYDTPFDLSLTFNGGSPVAMPTVDPPPSRNMYVASFSFDDSNNDYSSIEYSYTGSAQNRARFMGVVVDATAIPEPASLALLGLGLTALTLRRGRRRRS